MATIGKVGNIIQSAIATASETLAQVKMALVLRTDPATTGDVVHCHAEEEAAALPSHDAGHNLFHFKHFEVVVQSPHDHHYLDNNEQVRKIFFFCLLPFLDETADSPSVADYSSFDFFVLRKNCTNIVKYKSFLKHFY
jgi:hypothetical protein